MLTLKLKYICEDSNFESLILDYQRQYSSCLHIMYNRISDNPNIKEPEFRSLYSSINNCSLINKWLFQCSIKEARQVYNSHKDEKVIFGGKKNFFKRNNLEITNEQYKYRRLSPIYSIGEANQKSNRLFSLKDNLTVVFKPTRFSHYNLQLVGLGKKRTKIVNKLFDLANSKKIGLTYKLSADYIWISYDEKEVSNIDIKKINNRVFAIDLNPNYVGWSIIDWKSSSNFRVVKEGVISIKVLNDYDNRFKGNSSKRSFISRIRKHIVIEICKKLVDTAVYYRCGKFVLEDLNFKEDKKGKSKDKKSKGKKLNKLVNNQWCRDVFEQNITKRCNIFNISLVKVKPEYSSFVGNVLFRHISDMPDMVLASIEIGRRGYEFSTQYIEKVKEYKKNVIFPCLDDFKDLYGKSLEEFEIQIETDNWTKLYSHFKNTKITYRVPISNKLVGFRFRSLNRFVYNINKLT